MQTTEGYALRKLKGSPEVLVTRVIRGSQNMISMKKKKQQEDFLVTREPKSCSIATPNHPPTPPPPQTCLHTLIFTNLLVFAPK